MKPNARALSLVDAIATDIRDQLFDGTISVDEQLTEAKVAEVYGVARPTAKSAIEKLVVEGLLVRGPHKTARVPDIGAQDVKDLLFARFVVEGEAIRRLAEQRRMPEYLLSSNERTRSEGERSGVEAIKAVLSFHMGIVAELGSPRLDRVYGILMGEMRLCLVQMQARNLFQPDPIAHEHDAIIEAVLAGDPDAAVAALSAHLDQARDRMVPALERRSEATAPLARE